MRNAWIYAERGAVGSEAAALLAELGYTPRQVAPPALRPETGDCGDRRPPAIALVVGSAREICTRLRNDDDLDDVPVLLAVEPDDLRENTTLRDAHELIILPLDRQELKARIARACHMVSGVSDVEVIRAGFLEVNLSTYRVTIDGGPVAFTHLEYELLKFLVTHPGRVFTREALLSRVWGYNFYGGARTIDVHVRRVRAKLGRQHADCIRTVRSVGYCFEASTS